MLPAGGGTRAVTPGFSMGSPSPDDGYHDAFVSPSRGMTSPGGGGGAPGAAAGAVTVIAAAHAQLRRVDSQSGGSGGGEMAQFKTRRVPGGLKLVTTSVGGGVAGMRSPGHGGR